MSKEHEIALGTINEKIDSFQRFTYDEHCKEIIKRGGILRTSIMVTIRDYLDKILPVGVLFFDSQKGFYIGNPLFFLQFKRPLIFDEEELKEVRKDTGIENEKQLRKRFGDYIVDKNPILLQICYLNSQKPKV